LRRKVVSLSLSFFLSLFLFLFLPPPPPPHHHQYVRAATGPRWVTGTEKGRREGRRVSKKGECLPQITLGTIAFKAKSNH